jgi:hypothetical protein
MSHEIQLLQQEVAQLRDKVQEMESELRVVTQALPIEVFPGQWMSVSQFNSMKQQLEEEVQTGRTIPAVKVIEYLEKKDTSEAMSLESLFARQ